MKTMEIIDKDYIQIADDYYLKNKGYRVKNSVTEGFIDGYKEAESTYLKQIEEKNKDIRRIQARRTEITEEATRLKQELQEAKELDDKKSSQIFQLSTELTALKIQFSKAKKLLQEYLEDIPISGMTELERKTQEFLNKIK